MRQWESKELGEQGYSYIQILRTFYGYDLYLDSAEKVSGVPMSFPGYTLQVGSSGKEVRTVQEQLNTISNNYPAIKKVKVDGVYGDATKDAVITFQGIFNMPQTGIVDFATWYSISNVYVAVTRMAELV